MKASFITLVITIMLSGNLLAEKPVSKLTFLNNQGVMIEFFSKAEEVVEENTVFVVDKNDSITCQKPACKITHASSSFNIHDFIKVEKEVSENEIDTKTIFNQIIIETFYSK